MASEWHEDPAALRAYAEALEGAIETLDATGSAAQSGRDAARRIREEADDLERRSPRP